MNTDLHQNLAIGTTIQGHVGPNTKQVFETLDGQPFAQPKLKLAGYEFIIRDQFGNLYHKMRAVLFDGDMYDVDQWIKPSMMIRTGGGSAYFDDHAARQKLRVKEALLRELREVGAVALARMNVQIIKGRHTSTNPIAIETQDLTHQANVLEDAIVAAKQASGDEVTDKPVAVSVKEEIKTPSPQPKPAVELDVRNRPKHKEKGLMITRAAPSWPHPRDVTDDLTPAPVDPKTVTP